MNLYEIINDLYRNDKNYWDYYEGITVDPISNPSKAYIFINEIFSLGSKGNIFHNVFDQNENTSLVIRHDSHIIYQTVLV